MMWTYVKCGLAGLVLLSACATQPQEPPNPGPFPENYEQIVKAWLQDTLKDPYSLRELEITEPQTARVWVGLLNGGYLDGYRTCVSYNAKNGFGAYVGLKRYTVVLKDGAIASTPVGGQTIAEGCAWAAGT